MRPQGVAAIFDEPEAVSAAEFGHGLGVEGDAHGVGDHYGPRLGRDGGFDGRDGGHVGGQLHVDEDGDGPVLEDGVDGRGEAGGHGDDFVARPNPPVLELRRRQRAEGHQVGRRPGVDQQGRIAIHALGQRALELFGESAGGEPEVEAGLDGQLQFFGVEHAAGVADRALAGHERPRGEGRLMVLRDQVSDLAAYFFGL